MDDTRLGRIEAKLDDTNDHLTSIDITLAMQAESLRHHIKRTALIEKELAPIRKHVYMVQGAAALLSLIGIVIGILKTMGKI